MTTLEIAYSILETEKGKKAFSCYESAKEIADHFHRDMLIKIYKRYVAKQSGYYMTIA